MIYKSIIVENRNNSKDLLENCTYGSTDFRRRIEHENASTRQPTRDWGAQCFFQCRGSVIGVAGNRACAKSASSSWKSGRTTGAERRRKLATFYLARFTWHVLPGMTASSAHWTLQTTHNTPKGCRTGLQSKASSKSTRHSGVPAIGRLNHAEGISNARLASLQIGIAAAPKWSKPRSCQMHCGIFGLELK